MNMQNGWVCPRCFGFIMRREFDAFHGNKNIKLDELIPLYMYIYMSIYASFYTDHTDNEQGHSSYILASELRK